MTLRRNLLIAGSSVAGIALLGAGAEAIRRRRARIAAGGAVPRPPGVPVSRFSVHSTAEEVTAGIDLNGKTVLVTGVTSGIGLETMRVLALRGATVLGTGRDLARARAACSSVTGLTIPLPLELTDETSIQRCASIVHSAVPQLDVLICNAGIMALQTLEKVKGVEKQFATNHLGHFLLCNLLLDHLKRATQARVVVLSSGVLTWASPTGIEWDNLSGDRDYDANRMYGQSKLANALFSVELARRLAGTSVTSNSVHPGYVETKLFRHYPPSLRGFRRIFFSSKGMPVQNGAATSCYVATAPQLQNVSGHYFLDCNAVIPDPRATDVVAAERLWRESARLVGA